MREARELLARIRELRRDGRPAVVATIVAVTGSAYRREGARLLIEPDGAMTGVLSGGCVERELLPSAGAVLADGRPRTRVLDLSADEEAIWGFGLGCSGTITLLLEPLATAGETLERALAASIDERRTVRLSTRIRPAGARTADRLPQVRVAHDLEIEGAPSETSESRSEKEATAAMEGKDSDGSAAEPEPPGASAEPSLPLHWKPVSGPSGMAAAAADSNARRTEVWKDEKEEKEKWTAEEIELVETLRPPVHLVVVGAERDVTPLVRLAAELGWQATVVDARPTAAAEARLAPFARYLGAPPRRLADALHFDARTAVVVATHRYLDDLAYLGELERADLGYLGLLGPARRRERLLADLARQRGAGALQGAAVRGPAGLDLGGRSPEEVALAIVAEAQAALHGGGGGPLSAKRPRAAAEPAGIEP
jgi:xanthine/CO dehydrogenase XdhC/CoxF family maturation factor